MADLTTTDKQILEKLFQMGGGYVLNFSDRTMGEFFRDDIGINIYDDKYKYASGSKANYIRGFWMKADNIIVGNSILKLIKYIETEIIINQLDKNSFSTEILKAGKDIEKRLSDSKNDVKESNVEATFNKGDITISLQKAIFDHVQNLLNDGHYFNAVEESYKIVRQKLKEVSGFEKATDAFSSANFEKIFGHSPKDDVEKDFFEGIKFLHMSIQFLRNEKAHTPAGKIDKNLAIHYIALASLAYDLIS